MSATWSRRSIAFRQAKLVLLVACLLGLLFGIIQVYIDFTERRSNLEASVAHHAESTSQSAANALWELNGDHAEAIISGLFGFHPIVAAKITTTSDFVLAEGSRPAQEHALRPIIDTLFGPQQTKVFPLSYDDNGRLLPVGTLTIVCDPTSTAAAFLDNALVVIVSGVVQSLLLGLALTALFYLTLAKPLRGLSNQLNRIDVTNIADANEVSISGNDENELGQIARAINRYLKLIREHLTGLTEAHHAMQNANIQLEQKVAERTTGLTNEITVREETEQRLRVALRDAERSTRVRTQFLANMSHELRTPLNAILGYSEYSRLFLDRLEHEKVREYLDNIHSSGSHLLSLVNSILDLSRMDAGQMPVHLEVFDIGELIREVADDLEPVIKRNSNSITLNVTEQSLEISSDSTKARQVLYNLVGNAAKFTHQGEITVSAYLEEKNPERILLEVRDTGIGIEEEAIKEIFENFYQADATMARRFEGSGLGLAIVRNICRLLGWDVRVTSTVGQGSSFVLRIPRNPDSVAPPKAM